MDQHSLVCAAICINQRNKGGQCEPRGDGDGDVGDTVGRPGEDFVLDPENTRNAAELRSGKFKGSKKSWPPQNVPRNGS